MKRIICSLLVFCLLLPALAFAAPSQKLQAIYDSVDTLNVEELVALQDYVNAKIDASSAVNVEEHILCHKGAYTGKTGITRDRTGKPWYYRNLKR